MTRNEWCMNCRFWQRKEEAYRGRCRRHAPRPLLLTDDDPEDELCNASWPITMDDDWCGQWVSKESVA